jgi:exopolyphosphatase/guanosine-5'-triphosphate,3'-diphosphate pyrophosphatase
VGQGTAAADLVLGHRGKLEKLGSLPASDSAWNLIFCLRLAVLLSRTRDDRDLPAWQVTPLGNGFVVEIDAAWLKANPWTAAALNEEGGIWKQIGRYYQVRAVAAGD